MGINLGLKSPVSGPQVCPRFDTHELKHEIERKIGRTKSKEYCHLLTKFLSQKVSKSEFSKLCVGLVGKENICLHNRLVRAIIRNACVGKTPPKKYSRGDVLSNGEVTKRSTSNSFCEGGFAQSLKKGTYPTLRDCKLRDRRSPLGSHVKTANDECENLVPKVHEQQSATELLSLGSRPPVEVNSVEEGEEVEQAAGVGSPGIHGRSTVTAPLGISLNFKGTRKVLNRDPASFHCIGTCHNAGLLPDTSSLKKRLKQKLEAEGLNISADCTDLLNTGLDVYMKRLIKPCIELAASRTEYKLLNKINHEGPSVVNGTGSMRNVQSLKRSISVSLLDFRVAMETNPRLLGEEWPSQLEKVCLSAYEESV